MKFLLCRMGAVNSVRMQTDGLNLHGRLSAFPISRMHTSSSTDNKRRQFWHKSRPQILPRLRQFGREREPVGPLPPNSRYIRDSSSPSPPPPHPPSIIFSPPRLLLSRKRIFAHPPSFNPPSPLRRRFLLPRSLHRQTD